MSGRSINELAVGDTDEITRAVEASEIVTFLALVGDRNPVHSDSAFMSGTNFQEPIVPGMWTASLISAVIGTRLPGSGSIYASQDLRFLRPVKVGDTITARVEVVERLPERNRIRLKTTCTNRRGEVVLSGEAWVLPPKRPTAAAGAAAGTAAPA
ncbi:MAG: MaoC family dehydratase [Armatimonadota bacterium]